LRLGVAGGDAEMAIQLTEVTNLYVVTTCP
jgi:hypothetical protein